MLLYENRDQIPAEYKWRLEDIVKDNQAWEELFFKVDERIGHFSKYADKLADEDMLFDCLELETRLTHDITCLYQYAKMRLDQDTRDNTYQGMTNRVEMLIVKFSSATSFMTPEISEFSKARLEELKASKRFKNYDVMFGEIIRNKDIILSKKEEKILGEVGIFADTNHEVFSMFDNADVKFKKIDDGKGNLVEMSHGVYGLMLQNPDQNVRKAAFESIQRLYQHHCRKLCRQREKGLVLCKSARIQECARLFDVLRKRAADLLQKVARSGGRRHAQSPQIYGSSQARSRS